MCLRRVTYLRVFVLNCKYSNFPRYFQGTLSVPSNAALETLPYISFDGSPMTVVHLCKCPNINSWIYHHFIIEMEK